MAQRVSPNRDPLTTLQQKTRNGRVAFTVQGTTGNTALSVHLSVLRTNVPRPKQTQSPNGKQVYDHP